MWSVQVGVAPASRASPWHASSLVAASWLGSGDRSSEQRWPVDRARRREATKHDREQRSGRPKRMVEALPQGNMERWSDRVDRPVSACRREEALAPKMSSSAFASRWVGVDARPVLDSDDALVDEHPEPIDHFAADASASRTNRVRGGLGMTSATIMLGLSVAVSRAIRAVDVGIKADRRRVDDDVGASGTLKPPRQTTRRASASTFSVKSRVSSLPRSSPRSHDGERSRARRARVPPRWHARRPPRQKAPRRAHSDRSSPSAI